MSDGRRAMERVVVAFVAALVVSGCGVRSKTPDAAPAAQAAAVAAPHEEVPGSLRVVMSGLEVQVTQVASGLYRFDVRPAAEAAGGAPSAGTIAFDEASGSITLRADGGRLWVCRVAALDAFGRAVVPGVELSWKAWDGEALYGLGERFDALNQAGKVVDMWIEDTPGQGDAGRQSYYVTPVLYSTRGYAFFASQNPDGAFDLNASGDGANRYRRAGQQMTFHVAFGDSMKDLVRKRESVQGPHKGIPGWAWGPWISRNSFESQAEAEEVIEGMVKRGLPVAAIVQEAWKGSSESGRFNQFDPRRWPDLPRFFALCNRHGIKNVLWQVPVIHPSSPEFAVGKEKGYFVKKPDGSISFRQNWLKDFANVDFTNPDAAKYWQDLMRATVRLGVWGFKADDGEDIKPDDVFADGRRGWEMHNEYSTLYNRALTELLQQEGVDGLLWARSGSLGNERYPALWAGDQYARWGQLASLLPAGLSASISGMPFWGHDIGGYIGQPTPELYIRWAQFGALSPLMQYHGVLRREPWEFGAQAEAAYKQLANLRMNLVPTLIALGEETEATGLPIMRPMFMEFPDDARFVKEETQYMLGPDLLVAPVLEEGATGRKVEFPAGVWQHALHPVAFSGPASVEVPIGLVDAPLFVREGATLKLQLKEGAKPGEWSAGDPVREVKFGSERAVIRNLRAPLSASILTRDARIRFEPAASLAGELRAYWFMDANPSTRVAADVVMSGGSAEINVSPPARMNLTDQRQTYVVESSDGVELFRGSLRWESPVRFELDRTRIPAIRSGRRSVVARLVNRGAEAVSVRATVAATAGARVEGGPRTVDVPARGEAELRWDVAFDDTGAVGDTRLRFSAFAGDVVLDQQVMVFARVPRWIVAGPFPAPPGRAYRMTFAPEWATPAPSVAFRTSAGDVPWRQVSAAHVEKFDGIDFNEMFGHREQAAAYAMTRIRAERETPVELMFGSDDTLTVWLNGTLIYSVETYRLAAPDQEVVKATLRQGVNTLLVKVAQDKNPWRLLFRVTAPDGAPVSGLTDGFDDFTAFGDGRRISETVPGEIVPFEWRVLGPVDEVPMESSGWALPMDRMASSAEWPPTGVAQPWKPVSADRSADNLVDLKAFFGGTPERVVAYAATSFHADGPIPVQGVCGSDDGIVVWINGRKVHEAHGPRGFTPREDTFKAVLQPGLNRLLCRVSQLGGDWKYQLNLFDLSGGSMRPVSSR